MHFTWRLSQSNPTYMYGTYKTTTHVHFKVKKQIFNFNNVTFSVLQSATNSSKVDLAPFQIQPAILELLAGHTIPIQVTFTPTSVKHFSRDITMVCDNCTVKHFTIKGNNNNNNNRIYNAPFAKGYKAPGIITARSGANFEI